MAAMRTPVSESVTYIAFRNVSVETISVKKVSFLAYFPYFEKKKVGLCDLHAVSLSVIHPY
jgi:hypothetical protein